MTFRAGDIATLKSGGQALTITSDDAEDAHCIWLGEEGDLFRERIPLVALEAIGPEEEDDEGEEDEGDEADASEDDEEEAA